MAPDSVPSLRLDLRIRNYRGTLLLAWGEAALELSDTAAFVFRQIDGQRTVADIAIRVAAEFDIDPATALADITDALRDLAEHQMIESR